MKRLGMNSISKLIHRLLITIIFIGSYPCYIYSQELNTLRYQTGVSDRYLSYIKEDTTRIFSIIERAVSMNPTSDSALQLASEALQLSEQLQFPDGIGQAYMGLGYCAASKFDYKKSMELFQKAVPYCEHAIFRKYLPMLLYNCIAANYMYENNTKEAIYYYYKALDYSTKHNIKFYGLTAQIYISLGMAWMKENQLEQVIYYANKAIQLAINYKKYATIAKAYSLLGGIYIQKGDTAKGRYYSRMALDMSNKYISGTDDKIMHYSIYLNLGISYQTESPEVALAYFKKVLAIGFISPYYSSIDPYTGIGAIYDRLEKYKLAEKYLQSALKKAEAANLPNSVKDASFLLANTYARDNNFKKAFEYLLKASDLSDSLMDSAHVVADHEMEVRYRTSEKDKEIAFNKLQIQEQKTIVQEKNSWIIGITLGCLLIMVLFAAIYLNNKHRQRLQAEKIKNLQQEKEIDRLKAMWKGEEKERARIARELHDGIGSLLSAFTINFNALGKENYLTNVPNYINAGNILKQISTEVRATAHNFMPEILLHHSLTEAIRLYCDYIQFSKEKNIEIDVQSYGDVEQPEHEFKLSIYRIIQELLQNIIKHANATYALVQLIMRESILEITVEDNGVGFETSQNDDGLGLLNLQSRISSMGGIFTIESSKENGTSIVIEFDLKIIKQLTPT
ncbi:MAG TPA: ATP-binding protein [Flavipsychrobacter sp.]|nr:ATP-binding protein [Flavipsychrobacter sp.]